MRLMMTGVMAGVLLLLAAGPVLSADQDQTRERQQERMEVQQQEQHVYGWQLMTPEERLAYQNRLRAATTEQERNTIRNENHERMRERAKSQGITLPEEPGKWRQGDGMGAGGGGRGGR